MILDKFLQLSATQALTATAASTNSITLDASQQIGIGEPMALVVSVGVALGGTSPTISFGVETDNNSGFSSATTLVTSQVFTALAAGDTIVIPLGHTNEQYLRAKYTLGGTSPTATVDAYLQPLSMIDGNVIYANGYAIA